MMTSKELRYLWRLVYLPSQFAKDQVCSIQFIWMVVRKLSEASGFKAKENHGASSIRVQRVCLRSLKSEASQMPMMARKHQSRSSVPETASGLRGKEALAQQTPVAQGSRQSGSVSLGKD